MRYRVGRMRDASALAQNSTSPGCTLFPELLICNSASLAPLHGQGIEGDRISPLLALASPLAPVSLLRCLLHPFGTLQTHCFSWSFRTQDLWWWSWPGMIPSSCHLSVFQVRIGKRKQKVMNMELKKTNFLCLSLETKQVLSPWAGLYQDLALHRLITQNLSLGKDREAGSHAGIRRTVTRPSASSASNICNTGCETV